MTNATNTTRTATIRCIAWSHERTPHKHTIRVEADGSCLVWDGVAGHYTRCHSLSPQAEARARREARSCEEAAWDDAWDKHQARRDARRCA